MANDFAKYILSQAALKATNEKQAFLNAGFEIVKEGEADMAEWVTSLIMNYPQEVIAVYGADPNEVMGLLEDEWDTGEYEDKESGLSMSWNDWAEYFSNRVAHYVYDELCSLRKKYREAIND